MTALALVLVLAAPDVASVREAWPKLDRAGKIDALTRLSVEPSANVLTGCAAWIKDDDPVVQGQVVRLVAQHCTDAKLKPRAIAFLDGFVKTHLEGRRKKESAEFKRVCKEHGKELSPDDEMAAGSSWTDPWDEQRRKLPPEIRAERALMREVVGAFEGTGAARLSPALMRIFREHHDPEVLLRVVGAFAALDQWRALPAMADLARIQRYGREVGGSHVIGETAWRTMRLKWDVHKERLWWSRPEYVPRTVAPICRAASRLTGVEIADVAAFDGWLLGHPKELAARGVKLSPAFRKRARGTQR